jgi:hypothetical protein
MRLVADMLTERSAAKAAAQIMRFMGFTPPSTSRIRENA